jgi:hypothetical protein
VTERSKPVEREIARYHRRRADPKLQKKRAAVRSVFTLEARLLKAKDEVFKDVAIEWVYDSGLSANQFFITVADSGAVGGPMIDLKLAMRKLKKSPNDSGAYKVGIKALKSVDNIIKHWKKKHPEGA